MISRSKSQRRFVQEKCFYIDLYVFFSLTVALQGRSRRGKMISLQLLIDIQTAVRNVVDILMAGADAGDNIG